MFYGQYTIQLDHDKALTFPEYFSEKLSGNVFITKGIDRNLVIMPENSFTELYQRVISLNMAEPSARLLLRLFLGNAILSQLDGLQKMQLSEHLYAYAELSDESAAVLVGQGDHIEIWSQTYWEKQNVDLQDASINAHRFASLDLRF
ncbi:MAG: hypothetical protein HN736_04525 [Anaerolineae bacterium]|jgi:MraZ protein|nr:hypothetical protein [Anaerolineae bacterium]MBT3713932.1 hypothetical protein [Anaerolineae bacterium]MBT4311793.1 hypothetical protein [Anaerolineae bacterium]MBT4458931.1 hypothetical protein [Anaerolineae bacterium]MBT6060073.1 hypothetical protein [Anaerolineae bacterium]